MSMARDLMQDSFSHAKNGIYLNQWLDYFHRISAAHGGLKMDDIRNLKVVFGIWPLDEQVRQSLRQMYFTIQQSIGQNKSRGPTDRHVLKGVECIVGDEDTAEEEGGSILYEFMPHYMHNQVLTLSEWMGFWARFGLIGNTPTVEHIPRMQREMNKVETTEDTVPHTMTFEAGDFGKENRLTFAIGV